MAYFYVQTEEVVKKEYIVFSDEGDEDDVAMKMKVSPHSAFNPTPISQIVGSINILDVHRV